MRKKPDYLHHRCTFVYFGHSYDDAQLNTYTTWHQHIYSVTWHIQGVVTHIEGVVTYIEGDIKRDTRRHDICGCVTWLIPVWLVYKVLCWFARDGVRVWECERHIRMTHSYVWYNSVICDLYESVRGSLTLSYKSLSYKSHERVSHTLRHSFVTPLSHCDIWMCLSHSHTSHIWMNHITHTQLNTYTTGHSCVTVCEGSDICITHQLMSHVWITHSYVWYDYMNVTCEGAAQEWRNRTVGEHGVAAKPIDWAFGCTWRQTDISFCDSYRTLTYVVL